ncbi:hypothetical protein [Parendozoicomonas sp. Alg238-R29]|uniref:hypothetical protein n=1 Tax=Parendozoicomonas sp. Alg238-R29 TaxID=2993446 RepID=UPI00248F2487|nr:hypothetical protein [Parendozoicomonas sp. Alg238-R29]
MSMQVGGGGGVRPLGPPTQQPQVQQPATKTDTQAPQTTPGRAGQTLHNVNSFNSQPVSNDLEQLQQWLNKLKGGNQPQQTPAQQTAISPQGSNLQQAQQNAQTATAPQPTATGSSEPPSTPIGETPPTPAPTPAPAPAPAPAPTEKPVGTQTEAPKPPPEEPLEPPPPPPLTKNQKALLNKGLEKLGGTLGIGKADLARLTHAKATSNDALYFYQLGKLEIPPGSAKDRQLQTGLRKLFSAINSPGQPIAEAVKTTIVLDDVTKLAGSKAINLPPTLVVDLGALTSNEADRFVALAQAVGVPVQKAKTLLKGFAALGQQFDITPSELDSILGNASRTVNTTISVEMQKAARSMGISPELFNDLANAALTKDSKKFASIGQQAGLSRDQIKNILPKITNALSSLGKNPVITGEKLLRFTKDTSVQNQIYAAGKAVGLSQSQSITLAATFVDKGLSGYSGLAQEYGLKGNDLSLLNKLQNIEKQQGHNALRLATNNVESIIEQQALARELGLQTKSIGWGTTFKPAPLKPPSRGPFDFFNKIRSAIQSSLNNVKKAGTEAAQAVTKAAQAAQAAAQAVDTAKVQNEIRFVKLSDELQNVRQNINKLKKAASHPLIRHSHPHVYDKLRGLQNQEHNIKAELDKIKNAGHAPSATRVREIKLIDKLDAMKERLAKMESLAKKNSFLSMFHQPAINDLKAKIKTLEERLEKLR